MEDAYDMGVSKSMPKKGRMDDREVMMLFAARVTQARQRKNISQQQLAEDAATTYQTIWRIEKGSHKDVSMLLVRRVARALAVSTDYLIGMYDDPRRRAGIEQVGTESDTGSTNTVCERTVLQGV